MTNVYLISSNSVYLMEEEIKKIVKDNPYNSFDLNNAELEDIIESEQNYNPWFTPYFIRCAINALSEMLVSDNLYQWIDKYKSMITIHQSSKVGVILAGNIPMVGFHDFLSVYYLVYFAYLFTLRYLLNVADNFSFTASYINSYLLFCSYF